MTGCCWLLLLLLLLPAVRGGGGGLSLLTATSFVASPSTAFATALAATAAFASAAAALVAWWEIDRLGSSNDPATLTESRTASVLSRAVGAFPSSCHLLSRCNCFACTGNHTAVVLLEQLTR